MEMWDPCGKTKTPCLEGNGKSKDPNMSQSLLDEDTQSVDRHLHEGPFVKAMGDMLEALNRSISACTFQLPVNRLSCEVLGRALRVQGLGFRVQGLGFRV